MVMTGLAATVTLQRCRRLYGVVLGSKQLDELSWGYVQVLVGLEFDLGKFIGVNGMEEEGSKKGLILDCQ